jgi:hypothetical protein
MKESQAELGFSSDIALEKLLGMYAECEAFCSDLSAVPNDFNRALELSILTRNSIEEVFLSHGKNKFTYLTARWAQNWHDTPAAQKDPVERFTQKWGLTCDWGLGLIATEPWPQNWHWNFTSMPMPSTTIRLQVEVNPFTEPPGYIQRIANSVKAQIKQEWAKSRSDAVEAGFRGLESHTKKDIQSQVEWLFLHITPPYLSSEELALKTQNSEGLIFAGVYIERCYQSIAKLLGIELKRGWHKGRRRSRDLDLRAQIRSELTAKTHEQNEP